MSHPPLLYKGIVMNLDIFFGKDSGSSLKIKVGYDDGEMEKYHEGGLCSMLPGKHDIHDQGDVYCLCLVSKDMYKKLNGSNNSFSGDGWTDFLRVYPEFDKFFPYRDKLSSFGNPDEYISGLLELILRTAKENLHRR